MSLIDNIMAHLNQPQVDAIAARIGTDPDQARTAIEHALPLLVGGLSANAATPQGAQDLHAALDAHTGTDIGSLISGMFGAGGSGAGIGSAILGHIFGNNQTAASQGLGQATGLNPQSSAQLLAMLAPLVMSALGNLAQRHGLDPNGVGGVLNQEVNQAQQGGGGISSMLNQVLGGNAGGGLGGLMQAAGGLFNAFERR